MSEKLGQFLSFPGSTAFILKNSGSIDFLGPKELILLLAQSVSKNLLDPYKLFPDVFLVQSHNKKSQFFFTGKLDFFQKLFGLEKNKVQLALYLQNHLV